MDKFTAIKPSRVETTRLKRAFKVAPLCFITWMTLGYVLPAQAAVIVDINQHNIPTVKANANGSVTVNINPVSPGGISHNKFIQFDVSREGLVLNNSAEASQTTLAGKVAGNQNIAGGGASLIINEVTSNRTSQLNGQIEVAGKKADVIIANPAGIACNGCGFINTGRGTLTTGKLLINNDTLQGFDVENGNITVSGSGMNDASDYTSLLARTVNINASVRAKILQAMAGVNSKIVIDNNELSNTGNSGNASSTQVGLDVSALGGMYADKITLVTNQSGIGVSNAGLISATSDIKINSNGLIRNSKSITTDAGNIQLIAKRADNGLGSITATGNLNIIVDGRVDNERGRLGSDASVNINSLLLNNSAGLIKAKDISVVSDAIHNINSENYIAHDEDTPKSSTTKVIGGLSAESDINLNASTLLNNTAGTITSTSGTVSMVSDDVMVLNHARITGENVNIYSGLLDYRYVPHPDPADAKIVANKDISLDVGTLGTFDKDTVLSAGNDINISSRDHKNSGSFYNYGVLSAKNNINYNHGMINNYGIITALNDININSSESIANHKLISAGGNSNLNATRVIYNDNSGTIITGKKSTMVANSFHNNAGTIISYDGTDISSNVFYNSGYITGTVTHKPLP